MTVIDFKLEAEAAKASMKAMLERVHNPSNAMDRVGAMGWRDVMDHFKRKEGPDGPWEPFSKNTTRKRGKMASAQLLQDTGTLRSSIKWRNEGNQVVLYTACNYADYHEHQHKDYGRPPQRRFLWVSDITLKNILMYVTKFLAGYVN